MQTSVTMRILCCLLLGGCAIENVGFTAAADEIYFPSGIAAHPGGRYVYIVSSNADLRYNSATLATIDLDATSDLLGDNTHAFLPDQTQRMQSYGGAPTWDTAHKRLFVPTREQNQVYVFDVNDTGDTVSCRGEGRATVTRFTTCDSDHVFQLSGKAFNADFTDADVAEVWTGLVAPPEAALPGEYLYLTHLSAGVVSAYDITANSISNPKGFRPVTLLGNDVLNPVTNGTASIALVGASSATPMIYAGSNHLLSVRAGTSVSSLLYFFQPKLALGNGGLQGALDLTAYVGNTSRITDVKHLVTNGRGDRLYAVLRDPNALVVFDTSVTSTGAPLNNFVTMIALNNLPSTAVYVKKTDYNRALLYVSCFADGNVLIYDAETMVQVGRLLNRQQGPYALGVSYRPNGSARVMVSLFNDDGIMMYDSALATDSANSFLARIGRVRASKVTK